MRVTYARPPLRAYIIIRCMRSPKLHTFAQRRMSFKPRRNTRPEIVVSRWYQPRTQNMLVGRVECGELVCIAASIRRIPRDWRAKQLMNDSLQDIR